MAAPIEQATTTYPLRAVVRMTGLSPEILRAWERRYRAIEPLRTPGGTRRYRPEDVERLRLLKAAVAAGFRIGKVARLSAAELARCGGGVSVDDGSAQDAVLEALARLDADQAHRLLSLQLSALGPVRFAREFAVPLIHEIGDRWADGRLGIASEHLASAVLRSMLGSALTPSATSQLGPRIVFATPSGERHELGLQMAALTALGAGGHAIYLSADLPRDELLWSVDAVNAAVLALSLVALTPAKARAAVGELRRRLPAAVRLWIGGAASAAVDPIEGVERIDTLEQLEQRVTLLAVGGR
jgi:DNA-binding transcriptional MerR regulator